MYNILVTGCGGDIGQSIGKILQLNPLFANVIGSDIHNEHAGKFIFDRTHILPLCRDAAFMEQLENLIRKEQIDMVIPMSEAELRFFNEMDLQGKLFEKPLIMANKKALDIGFDKLATAEMLKQHSLPYPLTELVEAIRSPQFPLILKSRNGSGSKEMVIAGNVNDLSFYTKKYPGYIAQELLGDAAAEFTCGLFRSAKKETRHIIFRRKLTGGFSGFGVYEENASIEQLLMKLADILDLEGSINVQLRLTEKGPVVFEINPRFSSTVLFRHLMGFEDVNWSIENALQLSLSPYHRKKEYTRFYKGFNEYVD